MISQKTISHIKFVILILLVFTVVSALVFSDVGSYFSQEKLEEEVEGFGVWAPAVFVLFYAAAIQLFLPITPLILIGGFLFGGLVGAIASVFGATLGAVVGYLISRLLGRGFISGVVESKLPMIRKYDEKVEVHGILLSIFFRIIPIGPYNAVNMAFGLTRIRFTDYAFGTFLGMIPGSFIVANIGNNITDLANPALYVFLVLYIMLLTIPLGYKYYLMKDNKK